MYLKSIDIVGFKSFADRTHIELKPGISGVIGPNGCGKSNVMDSIRWCIGEMSWKALRSDSMVSVIFAGTARRNATSMAEVTLTFDNAQSMLPVQYSEVSVSRRLFRSGESEYYLNRTQCRLRDIRELFLDTGIGSDGYAIIDQGNVSFILESKPEERRALFEEAAGVSKYKAKREEALRKLERVDIDLGQLMTSVALTDEQIKKLDSDARKAQLYQNYKAELAVLEARQAVLEIDASEKTIAAETERVAPASQRLSELDVEVAAEEGRLAALNLERTHREASLVETNARISEIKAEIGRLEGRVHGAQSIRSSLREQIAASEQDLARERAEIAEYEPRLASARAEVEKASASVSDAQSRRDAFAHDLEQARAELAQAQARREAAATEALAAAELRQESSRKFAKTEADFGRCEYNVRQSLKDLDKKQAQFEAEQREAGIKRFSLCEARAWFTEAAQVVERQEAAYNESVRAFEAAVDELRTLREEEIQLCARIDALEAQGSRDPYWVGAHLVCESGLPGILGTVQSKLKAEEPWRTHLEDALGERLYAVLCEDPAAARAGIQYLHDAGKGRARFLVMSTLPEDGTSSQIPAQAQPLLESIQYDSAYGKAVRHLLAESYAYEGNLYGSHWVCGGSLETAGAAPKLSELIPARERLNAVRVAQEAAALRRTAAETERTAAQERLREARAQHSVEQEKHHRAAAELRRCDEHLPFLEQESAQIEKDCAGILAEIARVQEDLAACAAELRELGEEEQRLRLAQTEAAQRYDEVKERVIARQAQEEHFEQNLRTLREHEQNLIGHLGRVEAGLAGLRASIDRRLEQHQGWERRIAEEDRSEAEAREALDAQHRILAEQETGAQSLHAQVQEMVSSAENLQTGLRSKQEESSALRKSLQESEIVIATQRGRLESLLKRLNEEIGLTLEQAREKHPEKEIDPERMSFLKRRIEALGNVNLAAPEEYEELRRKRDYLQGQVDDLNKAKDDLRTAIQKINATTRENFRQTYNEVRDHFRRLYSVLFEGGEADLVLTDAENMLETGVEILAQPPGKRLQSISLLSGGEKTLTAIALLFSFFMVKPSPICMLDEADAALDDANVDRFVSMLRQFAGRTQFLIVSHNKKTMEACDVMYGVTMEESGVSQIISVDFRKRGETAQEPAVQESSAEPAAAALSEVPGTDPMTPAPAAA
jgi:chromosome segregation protein